MSANLRQLLDLPTRAAPRRSFEYVEGWGMSAGERRRVLRPASVEELRALLARARTEGQRLALRGTGCSYGDASLSAGGDVLDLSRMDRILEWDPARGRASCEPGVTIEKLWRTILPDGWWPRVVPGTMFPTLGGVASMNIHGKNNYEVGTIGDAIREFEILLPNGELRTASREHESALFHAAIGGFGMLGVFTRIELETKKVHSGELEVRAVRAPNLEFALEHLESQRDRCDYLVAWIDAFARGRALGRGLIHEARYLEPGEDEHPEETLQLAHQDLPAAVFGVPKSEAWRALRLLNNDAGMRLLNAVKFHSSALEVWKGPYRQAHAAFAFLLDYVPNWKFAYGRAQQRGLIQYQVFAPRASAAALYREILERCQRARIVPYLGVLKRHRPDPFWLTHALDGYSLALDFKVAPERRAELWKHCEELSERVLDAGGRFYFAKDSTLTPAQAQRMFPPENLARFRALKRELDPQNLLQTALSQRLFGEFGAQSS
ncbi:MAG: FAD-binding oxidoreductase [Planctomycetes bacterium]|nr:FAD-binding oxidoreductase [Planctomycetota bacterium]